MLSREKNTNGMFHEITTPWLTQGQDVRSALEISCLSSELPKFGISMQFFFSVNFGHGTRKKRETKTSEFVGVAVGDHRSCSCPGMTCEGHMPCDVHRETCIRATQGEGD